MRFAKAYREAVDWMYADPKALAMYAQKIKSRSTSCQESLKEFHPKSAMQTDRWPTSTARSQDAVKLKFLDAPLTKEQLAEFLQIPPREMRKTDDAMILCALALVLRRFASRSTPHRRAGHAQGRDRPDRRLGQPDADARHEGRHLPEARHRAGELRHAGRRRDHPGGDLRLGRYRHRDRHVGRDARVRARRADPRDRGGLYRRRRPVLVRASRTRRSRASRTRPTSTPCRTRPTARPRTRSRSPSASSSASRRSRPRPAGRPRPTR